LATLGGVVSIGEEGGEARLADGDLHSVELDLERSEISPGGGVGGRSPERGDLPTVVTGGFPESFPLLPFP
jgi:hypothetical protein